MVPTMPLPPMAARPVADGATTLAVAARARIALASGWLEPVSSAAAAASTSVSLRPAAMMSVTLGLPSVSVPVLSNATVVMVPMVSSTVPPFSSSPRRAPEASPAAMAAGTEITSAHGQPISRMARPL